MKTTATIQTQVTNPFPSSIPLPSQNLITEIPDIGTWGNDLNNWYQILKQIWQRQNVIAESTTTIADITGLQADLDTLQKNIDANSGGLKVANNLNDVSSVPESRENLGLGTAAIRDVPDIGDASDSQVVLGSDGRLKNKPASPTGPAGGDLLGFYPNPVLANILTVPPAGTSYGSTTRSVVLTADAKGRLSALTDVAIAFPGSTSAVTVVDTIAGLRAMAAPAVNGDVVIVAGYATRGDGGGGSFYWDSSSTSTDNKGTIIKLTGTTTGRFFRVLASTEGNTLQGNTIDVRWFGAIPDFSTDCGDGGTPGSGPVGHAYATFIAGTNGACLYFPAGNYLFSTKCTITGGPSVTIKGDGVFATSFMYNVSGASTGLLVVNIPVEVSDLAVNSLVSTQTNTEVFLLTAQCKLRNLYFNQCPNNRIIKCTSNADVQYLITDSPNSYCQWWQEGGGLKMDRCSLSTGATPGASTFPCLVNRGSGSGSTTAQRITNSYFKGAGPWSSYDGGTAYITVVISGDYGTSNEGMMGDCYLDSVYSGGNPSNSIALLLECQSNSYTIATWMLSNLWLNAGVIGLALAGVDAGSSKTVQGIAVSNIITRPNNSPGVSIIGCKDVSIGALSTQPTNSSPSSTTGVFIGNTGSQTTAGITIFGSVSPTSPFNCINGVQVDGTLVHDVLAVFSSLSATHPYLLSSGASKTQNLVFQWTDGSGGMNFSGATNQNV